MQWRTIFWGVTATTMMNSEEIKCDRCHPSSEQENNKKNGGHPIWRRSTEQEEQARQQSKTK
jgi:hypothetical protein